MIRPTRQLVIWTVGALPFSLAAVAIDPGMWLAGVFYLVIVFAAALYDYLQSLPPKRLGIDIRPIDALYIGEPAQLDIALTAYWHGAPQRIEARCDHDPILESPELIRAPFAPAPAIQIAIPLRPSRRGLAGIDALWLRWTGPLGLVERATRMAIGAKIHVMPNIRSVRQAAVHLQAWDALHGVKMQQERGEGSEFDAMREYVPGLDKRGIDWKHSARHRRLLCKEFRTERNHQIILAIDTGHLMQEPLAGIPKLDHAINAGLLLGFTSLKSGDRVGLFSFDSRVRKYAAPVGGTQHFPRLQRLAAELDYSAEETNFTLGLSNLTGKLNQRSLIVLITDFIDTVTAELMVDNLARLAKKHLILCVTLKDPDLAAMIGASPSNLNSLASSVVAGELRRERSIVFEKLRRLGVQILEAPHQRIGAELINCYLMIKQREMI